jgi:hypothetical protein
VESAAAAYAEQRGGFAADRPKKLLNHTILYCVRHIVFFRLFLKTEQIKFEEQLMLKEVHLSNGTPCVVKK